MYAIVDIAGKQMKATPNSTLYVPKLNKEVDQTVIFDQVLLVEDADINKVYIGKPFVEAAKVTAKVVAHVKGDKVTVFKKKRRKGYKVKRGHRQDHTQLTIEKITLQ